MIGQGCLQDTPVFEDQGGEEVARLENDNLYLIPAYTFSCHGDVIKWGACVESVDRYTILFYVFRPSGLPDCYTLVGTDMLVNATTNVDVSCVTLEMFDNPISVQPGDIVGVLPMSNRVGNGIEVNVSVTGVTAWYASMRSFVNGGPSCAYKTAPDGNLPFTTTSAPVIGAVVGEPCMCLILF